MKFEREDNDTTNKFPYYRYSSKDLLKITLCTIGNRTSTIHTFRCTCDRLLLICIFHDSNCVVNMRGKFSDFRRFARKLVVFLDSKRWRLTLGRKQSWKTVYLMKKRGENRRWRPAKVRKLGTSSSSLNCWVVNVGLAERG